MQKLEIAHEILAYLVDHPEAQDTLDGIVQWWLLERKIKYQTEIVKQTLAELVAKGFILEYKRSDSKVHYGINKVKYGEIITFLKARRKEE